MKLQILSDTHNSEYTLSTDVDLIVHAGDLGNGLYSLYKFVEKCKEINKPYVLVLGNHDFYGSSLKEVYNKLDKDNINYLKEGKEFLLNGYTFVGGTLFTNFRSNKVDECTVDLNKQNAFKNIYDFHTISNGFTYNKDFQIVPKYITPNDYHAEFNKQWNWIQQYKNKEKVILLTHFPSHISCLSDFWKDHPTASDLNPYFVNDLSLEGFKLAINGHIHHFVDTVEDGCRVVTNPKGYPSEHDLNGFVPNMIIDLKDIYGNS